MISLNEKTSAHDEEAISEASSDLDHNSSTGRSTHTPSSNSSNEQDANARAAKHLGISASDQKIVNCSRSMFLFCLMASAAALASAVYFYAHTDEMGDFIWQFESMGNDVIDLSGGNVHRLANVLQSLSLLTTSFLIAEREEHPEQGKGFVTIPGVEQHFGTARQNSGAIVLAYLPDVQPSEVEAWNQYSNVNQGWIEESLSIANATDSILPSIWKNPEEDRFRALAEQEESTCGILGRRILMSDDARTQRVPVEADAGPFSPVWTFSPPPRAGDVGIVNFDMRFNPIFRNAVDYISATKLPTFLDVCNHAALFDNQEYGDHSLQTVVVFPVFDGYDRETAEVVGHLIAVIPWEVFYQDIMLHDSPPMRTVVKSTCQQVFTFEIVGRAGTLVSKDDMHDTEFEHLAVIDSYSHLDEHDQFYGGVEGGTHGDGRVDLNRRSEEVQDKTCRYTVSVYPTKAYKDTYVTTKPVWYAIVVLGAFFMTSLLFIVFDRFVRMRTDKVITVALRQNAIVSSLFPKAVQAKMMAEADQNDRLSKMGKAGIKSYLNAASESGDFKKDAMAVASKPIADLFPETTIMFADIAGFTAWASAREPSQVFTLLEGIYSEFDRLAQRRRVFKVEVVGDCYVAVSGLPDPRKDHVLVMAKFALECLREMDRVTDRLVLELGPDTNTLKLRVGLHSGPVVAGVLRGDKSRFQLFGDTMNTASRMESTGVPNRIQVSQETADLLIAAGKKDWLTQRSDLVSVKGKGELVTFFLNIITNRDAGSNHDSFKTIRSDVLDGVENAEAGGFHRITEWTVEVMAGLLKDIVTCRKVVGSTKRSQAKLAALERHVSLLRQDGKFTVIDEVQEIIELPDFRHQKTRVVDVQVDPTALEELREYIRSIARMYNDNPFHNFEHANHVTMSVVKLLSRIVAPDIEEVGNKSLDDHTYGITADPLTRFAVVFAALIHDVEHSGVSNLQLVKEASRLATLYNNKSVAEQNSVDVAWGLLMEPQYENLRYTIYSTSAEFHRFRSLVVNAVMATDIMDKDLKKLRNDRWDIAFDPQQDQVCLSAVNRKATIVIEHLIQASDVAHTMQHWHVYRRWNQRLFQEQYRAYQMGRLESDPSESWYQGEMGFFDFYIIPLAKKLKDCGVFGVSSDEYLSYALQNRKEWERRGKTIVDEMVMALKQENPIGDEQAAISIPVDRR